MNKYIVWSMEYKTCSKCGIEKPLKDYYISIRDGIFAHCKECNKKRSREYFFENHEERLKINKEYYETYKELYPDRVKKTKENWRKNNKKYMQDYKKNYRHTEHGKIVLKKSKEKRSRNKGFVPLFENPFPNEIEVDYHHINNLLVIPLPKVTHKGNLGKNHIEKCNKWIQKLYCLDVNKLIR